MEGAWLFYVLLIFIRACAHTHRVRIEKSREAVLIIFPMSGHRRHEYYSYHIWDISDLYSLKGYLMGSCPGDQVRIRATPSQLGQ